MRNRLTQNFVKRGLCFLGLLMVALATQATGDSAPAASTATRKSLDAADYLKAAPRPGDIVSDVVFRTATTKGTGMDEAVWRSGGTGSYTILEDSTPGVIKFKVSYRIEGTTEGQDAIGAYLDDGKTMTLEGKSSVSTDASGPFFNPTFWGNPTGELKVGMSWTVELTQPWEIGPPGRQTVAVLAVDEVNGTVLLKREGQGEGPFAGAQDSGVIKRDKKEYHVAIKRGTAHWIGQAMFQHGIVVSDELLCDRPVELSSPELGVIHARARQYMSVSQHPTAIEW